MSLDKDMIKEVVKEMIRDGEIIVRFDHLESRDWYAEVSHYCDVESYFGGVNIRLEEKVDE